MQFFKFFLCIFYSVVHCFLLLFLGKAKCSADTWCERGFGSDQEDSINVCHCFKLKTLTSVQYCPRHQSMALQLHWQLMSIPGHFQLAEMWLEEGKHLAIGRAVVGVCPSSRLLKKCVPEMIFSQEQLSFM